MIRLNSTALFIVMIIITGFSSEVVAQEQKYEYAVVTATERDLARGYRVYVDLGESPEEIELAAEYSEILDKKKSLAAILNFMAQNGFELVQAVNTSSSFQGTGSTNGPVFFFRRKL